MPGPRDDPPITQQTLARDLRMLGVATGSTLVMHSSLSAIGWVEGGTTAVIGALLDTLGEHGTLAMPAATPLCSDPIGSAEDPPVFDAHTTPTTLGAIPEAFRTWPGTLRSSHPLESVCARGPLATQITAQHPLAFSEGPGSPFGKLYEMDCRVLLLGVGFNRCTALHTAESLVEKRRTMVCRFPGVEDGRSVWIEIPNVADDNDTHFPIIGEEYLAQAMAREGTIGTAPSLLFPMRDLVDFARRYFEATL